MARSRGVQPRARPCRWLRARGSRWLWGLTGGSSGAVRVVHRVFQRPFPVCLGRSYLVPVPVPVPVPVVASVVVHAPGALQRAGGCVWPVHNGVWCQGGLWLGVRQRVVFS